MAPPKQFQRNPPSPRNARSRAKKIDAYDPTKDSDPDFERTAENRRITTVEAARSIYNRFVQDDVLRSQTIAQTRNQLEGGQPFDQTELEAQGAGWQTNVNFGDAQAQRDRTLLPYWKLINDVPHKANFIIETKSPKKNEWEIAFAETYDEFWDDWGADRTIQFMNFANNNINFGPGIAQWQDQDSPRWKSANVQRVYWPKNTHMSPECWEVICLVSETSASELFQKIRTKADRKRSDQAGWNVNAVKAAIVQISEGGEYPDYRDYSKYQDQLVNNDIMVSTPFQPMDLIWLYVKNFDGKIGLYAFSRTAGVEEFIYRDDNAAESFRHLLGAVWYDTGVDGMVHSIKGFAIKNYHFSALLNRMKSRLVDSSTVAMSVNFQYDQDGTPDETPPVENYGPFTIFPSGIKQMAVYPQIQASMAAIQSVGNNELSNNSIYQEQQQQIEETDTATQAKLLAAMQGEAKQTSAAIFLAQYGENVQTEEVRRLRRKGNRNEDAKRFVERLKDKGVPEDIIFNARLRVKTGANSGMASPALQAQLFQEGLALSKLPGVNGAWFLKNYIAYKYGASAIQPGQALMPEGAESMPAQRRQADMENAIFGGGMMLPVAPEDAHYEHLQEHLKPLAQIEDQFKQTGQLAPEQLAAMTITLEHSAQHMGYLQADESMKEEFQQVVPLFRSLQNTAKQILSVIQKQQRGPVPVGGPVSGQPQQLAMAG